MITPVFDIVFCYIDLLCQQIHSFLLSHSIIIEINIQYIFGVKILNSFKKNCLVVLYLEGELVIINC